MNSKPSANLVIRPCNHVDLEIIHNLEQECFGEKNALTRIALTQYFDLWRPAFAVAEINSNIVGFAVGGIALDVNHKTGWLLDVAVDMRNRRAGIGYALSKYVITIITSFGVQKILATVSPTNIGSVTMLNSLKFTVQNEITNYFGEGYHRLLMEKIVVF